jgi:GNAT superfamily N-acetyltransferase
MSGKMNVAVREAQLGDLDRLVEFTVSEAREAEGINKSAEIVSEGIKAGLENSAIAKYWVLEKDDGQVIGSISVVREWSDWHAGYYWWIQSMFITPAYRGKGLMNLLVQAVRDSAIREKALDLRLYVHNKNKRAVRAYEKAGFEGSEYTVMIKKI